MKRALILGPDPSPAVAKRRPRPRARLSLQAGEVDLWRVALDEVPNEVIERLRATLSADEQDRAREFYFDRDRRRFVVGRGALRTVLADYLGCRAVEITFSYGANGKPGLAEEWLENSTGRVVPVSFNVAHSEGIALFAVTASGEIGIDLERIRDLPDWESIASTYFAGADQARIQATAPEMRRTEFFRVWTRQEAVLKATGLGLGGMDERGSEWRAIGISSKAPAPAVHASANHGYRIFSFSPMAGHIAALAVGADVRAVACLQWTWPDRGQPMRAPRRSRRVTLDQLLKAEAQFL
jgi:4'-phosphopantetheinyl transferase